jgi:hypothetical protein
MDKEPPKHNEPMSVEDALAFALAEATKAQRWDVVSKLADELQARRLAAAGVASLDNVRVKRSTR